MTMMTMAMMMMIVLTYNVDLHITLLGPRRKHLKGGRLPRVEVTNLQQKDQNLCFASKLPTVSPTNLHLSAVPLYDDSLGEGGAGAGLGGDREEVAA